MMAESDCYGDDQDPPGGEADKLHNEVRVRAMDLLARREHSRVELQRKLRRRDYPQALIGAVLDELAAEGLQDDLRFAEQFVNARQRRGQGMLRIRGELRERGVSDARIEAALECAEQDWMTGLREAHRKRFGRLPGNATERARQARFLHYRGFTSEQVRALFRDEYDEDMM